jgi:hypothetical protein
MRTRQPPRRAILLLLALIAVPPIADASAAAKRRSDLVVASVAATPASIAPGGTLSLKDVTKNRGRARAGKSATGFYLSRDRKRSGDDIRLGQRVVGKLRRGRKSPRTARFRVPAIAAVASYRVLACADDRKKVKETNERNNCRVTKAPLQVVARSPGNLPAAPDSDNDGVPDSADCSPSNGSVNQAAADAPDLDFADTNCDGIDGDARKAVFVAPSGNDAAGGTRSDPKRTIAAGIAAASAASLHHVYAAVGAYPERVVVTDGVSVYGGYALDWSRPGVGATEISNATAAGSGIETIVATDVGSTTTLQLLTVRAGAASAPGISVYGVRAANSSGLVLEGLTVTAGSSVDAPAGTTPSGDAADGGPGGAGNPGAENSTGFCSSAAQPAGGLGGTSLVGRPGGKGGLPGLGIQDGFAGDDAVPDGGLGGPGVLFGATPDATNVGQPGSPGDPGADGVAGSPTFGASFAQVDGAAGSAGGAGRGAGGGGGGSGGDDNCDSYGSSGGGGGGGAAGGGAGTGGGSAGGSFAVYLSSSNATIASSSLTSGDAGDGGVAGAGQPGGSGGDPGPGGPYGGGGEQDDASNGASGGRGGDGGDGGDGGGGAGGPSIGILRGSGSAPNISNTTIRAGSPGSGGVSAGNAGPAGVAAAIYVAP